MCILAGCDYVAGPPGVGLRTAYKLLRKHGDAAHVLKSIQPAHIR